MNETLKKMAGQIFESNLGYSAVSFYGGPDLVYLGTIENPAAASQRSLHTANECPGCLEKFLPPEAKAVRLLDMKRAAAALMYRAAKKEFLLEQPVGILAGAVGGPVLESAAEARIQTVVDYIDGLLRLRLEQDWANKPLDYTAQLFIPLYIECHLQDLMVRHPDDLVRYLAEFGDWRVHFLSGDVVVTYGGCDPTAPYQEM